MTRICARCTSKKSTNQFGKTSTGWRSYCLECWRILQSEYRRTHREQVARYRRDEMVSLRLKVDTILGMVCVKCGFSDKRALEIDHVNDDGAEDRRKGSKNRATLHRRVIANPVRYQRLCSNCNNIKEYERVNGVTVL